MVMTQCTIYDILSEEEKVLDYLLNYCKGYKKRINMVSLSEKLDIEVRRLRKIISDLKAKKQYRVKSSTSGYYIELESDPTNNMALSRAKSSINTAVNEDFTNLVKLFKHLNDLKNTHPSLHNQIKAIFLDDEFVEVKRYAD